MPFFTWDPESLSLNIDAMDSEHRVLIDMMNKLYDCNAAGGTRQELSRIIERFVKVTEQHFKHEEAYLDSVAYPDRETHKVIHTQLLNRLQDYVLEFENGSGGVSEGFFKFLLVWLTAHIMGIDKSYSTFVHLKKAEGA